MKPDCKYCRERKYNFVECRVLNHKGTCKRFKPVSWGKKAIIWVSTRKE